MNSSCNRITENSALANCVIDVFVCTVNLTQSRSDSASEMSTVRNPSPSVCFREGNAWDLHGLVILLSTFSHPIWHHKIIKCFDDVPSRRRSWRRLTSRPTAEKRTRTKWRRPGPLYLASVEGCKALEWTDWVIDWKETWQEAKNDRLLAIISFLSKL